MFSRKIDSVFDEFYELGTREVLLVDGARQVGKALQHRNPRPRRFPLYYFNSANRPAEVDFLIEKDGAGLPIEVKSGKNYKTHASLDNLLEVSDCEVERQIVVSNANVSSSPDGRIRNLPAYCLMFLEHDGLPDETRFVLSVPNEDDIVFKT